MAIPGSRSRQGSPSLANLDENNFLDMTTTCTRSENHITLSKTTLMSGPTFFKARNMVRVQCNVEFLFDKSDLQRCPHPPLANMINLNPQLCQIENLKRHHHRPTFREVWAGHTSLNQPAEPRLKSLDSRERWESAGGGEVERKSQLPAASQERHPHICV